MKINNTKEGLIIPVIKKPLKPKYPNSQLQDEDKRKRMIEILHELSILLELYKGSGRLLPSNYDIHYPLWCLLRNITVGENSCPEGEQWC